VKGAPLSIEFRGAVLIAQPEGQHQVAGDLPLVLAEHVVRLAANVGRSFSKLGKGVRQAKEEIGLAVVGEAGAGAVKVKFAVNKEIEVCVVLIGDKGKPEIGSVLFGRSGQGGGNIESVVDQKRRSLGAEAQGKGSGKEDAGGTGCFVRGNANS